MRNFPVLSSSRRKLLPISGLL